MPPLSLPAPSAHPSPGFCPVPLSAPRRPRPLESLTPDPFAAKVRSRLRLLESFPVGPQRFSGHLLSDPLIACHSLPGRCWTGRLSTWDCGSRLAGTLGEECRTRRLVGKVRFLEFFFFIFFTCCLRCNCAWALRESVGLLV